MPTIFTRGENSIVPIDSVLRVIEVKSKLDSNGVKQIINASKKLKWDAPGGLMIYNHIEGDPSSTNYPFMSVFAYSSSATKMDEFKRFRKVDSEFDKMVKSICILNKGVWSSSSEALLSDDPVKITISYLIRLLDKIESDASTRSNFHLSSWLCMQT